MLRKPMLAPTMQGALEATLSAFVQADTKTLQAEWRRLHRAPAPPTLSHDLLLRGVAYKLQEAALGGLPPISKRKLAAWGQGAEEEMRSGSNAAPTVHLKSGTTLLRAWHGQTHTVQVLEDGYEHKGKRYSSLSHIAKTITGTHWSGPRFFGLTKRRGPSGVGGSADA